jgi:nucleoside-triphosphatase THEP1
MSTQSLSPFKNLLLTSFPGCGKTPVLKRVAEHLGDRRLTGFLTLELRQHHQRVGFEAAQAGALTSLHDAEKQMAVAIAKNSEPIFGRRA